MDRAVRDHIKNAGFEQYFIHRTGHSIGTEVHANGANMDDLEIHDERRILPNSLLFHRARHLSAGIRGAQRSKRAGQAQGSGSNR